MRRRLVLGIAVVGLAVGGYTSFGRPAPVSRAGASTSTHETSPRDTPAALSAAGASAAKPAVEEGAVPAITTTADLDRYLDGLEARVKSGAETGDELELALAAAKKGDATIGKERTRMKLAAFEHRVHLVKRDRAIASKMNRIGTLGDKLKEAKDPAERARLSREYTAAMADLPPNARAEAAARLDKLRGS